jgi:acetolactate synthase regulatory subunit
MTRYRGFEVFLMAILHCLDAALLFLIHITRGIDVQHGVSREGATGENVQTRDVSLRSKFRKLSRIEIRWRGIRVCQMVFFFALRYDRTSPPRWCQSRGSHRSRMFG